MCSRTNDTHVKNANIHACLCMYARMHVCIFMYSHVPKKNMEKEFSTVIFKRPRFIAFFDPPFYSQIIIILLSNTFIETSIRGFFIFF